jgi:hypothetical protein
MNIPGPFLSGAVFGAALVAYGVLFRRSGVSFRHPAARVFYGLAILAGALPVWLGPDAGAGGFSGAFLIGGLSSALAALIYAVFVYVYNARVDDGLLTEVRAYNLDKHRSQGSLNAKLEARLARATQPAPFAASVFVSLTVAGAVASLLSAALLKATA